MSSPNGPDLPRTWWVPIIVAVATHLVKGSFVPDRQSTHRVPDIAGPIRGTPSADGYRPSDDQFIGVERRFAAAEAGEEKCKAAPIGCHNWPSHGNRLEERR